MKGENQIYYKISWQSESGQIGSVYCCGLFGAIFLFFQIKKTEPTTKLTFCVGQNEEIVVLGGKNEQAVLHSRQ